MIRRSKKATIPAHLWSLLAALVAFVLVTLVGIVQLIDPDVILLRAITTSLVMALSTVLIQMFLRNTTQPASKPGSRTTGASKAQ